MTGATLRTPRARSRRIARGPPTTPFPQAEFHSWTDFAGSSHEAVMARETTNFSFSFLATPFWTRPKDNDAEEKAAAGASLGGLILRKSVEKGECHASRKRGSTQPHSGGEEYSGRRGGGIAWASRYRGWRRGRPPFFAKWAQFNAWGNR